MSESSFQVKAVQSYKARKKGELSFKTDQIITVTKTNPAEFLYFGEDDRGKTGALNFPQDSFIY
jgi:hypothetical protein